MAKNDFIPRLEYDSNLSTEENAARGLFAIAEALTGLAHATEEVANQLGTIEVTCSDNLSDIRSSMNAMGNAIGEVATALAVKK